MAKAMQRGEYKSIMVDGVECLVWKDNKVVPLVNNISDPNRQSMVPHRNKDGTRSQISCPESVKQYNAFMGGVDMFDSRWKTYSCSRKSKKWWMRLFYFLLDSTVTNAYILYKETSRTKPLTMKNFLLKLAEHLLRSTSTWKRKTIQKAPSARRLHERHFVDHLDRQQQLRVCKERRRTTYCYKDCCSQEPIPLCPTVCFRIYHTKENYQQK